jgi:hypothetical protein
MVKLPASSVFKLNGTMSLESNGNLWLDYKFFSFKELVRAVSLSLMYLPSNVLSFASSAIHTLPSFGLHIQYL